MRYLARLVVGLRYDLRDMREDLLAERRGLVPPVRACEPRSSESRVLMLQDIAQHIPKGTAAVFTVAETFFSATDEDIMCV